MKISVLVTFFSVTLAAFSDSDRCGNANNGLMCDPNGLYGPCCSHSGYCGSTPAYCSLSIGCQSGCSLPRPTLTPIFKCGDGFCDVRSETCFSCPSDCGECDLQYLDKCFTRGQITLTFDDGPDQYSPKLLSLSRRLGVRPTHFVIGSKLENTTYQKYLKQYYAAGHIIASHTYTHPYLTQLTDAEIRDEMIKTDDAIFKVIGVRPIYMRNPYSDSNERTMALLDSMGYKSIFTSLDTQDTEYDLLDAFKITRNVHNGLRAGIRSDPYVITQHETLLSSIYRLPKIIRQIHHCHYSIVDIDECFGTRPYRNDVCGDGKCSGYIENCQTCPRDCGTCPNP